MKKIKVLQVTGSLRVGGVETVAMNLLRYIDKNKYDFDYLVYGNDVGEYENEAIELGARILRVPLPKEGYKAFYNSVCATLEKNGPYDIVHSHVLFNSGIIMKAAAKSNVPRRISHAHDNLTYLKLPLNKKIYNAVMKRWLIRYSTDFLACANAAGDYVFGNKEFISRGKVLYNGIDVEKFIFSNKDREKIKKEFNIENKVVIGNIGRLAKQKNHKFLLEVFKKVNNKLNDATLLIIGDGELRGELEDKIKELNLEEHVIMTGTRSDIPSLLSAMDLFILPSIHEGLGIVLIEAQANGLPCIVPKGIVPEESKILRSFRFLDEDSNIEEWANAIIKGLQETNRNDNAVNEVNEVGYNVKNIGEEIDSIYGK